MFSVIRSHNDHGQHLVWQNKEKRSQRAEETDTAAEEQLESNNSVSKQTIYEMHLNGWFVYPDHKLAQLTLRSIGVQHLIVA